MDGLSIPLIGPAVSFVAVPIPLVGAPVSLVVVSAPLIVVSVLLVGEAVTSGGVAALLVGAGSSYSSSGNETSHFFYFVFSGTWPAFSYILFYPAGDGGWGGAGSDLTTFLEAFLLQEAFKRQW